MINEKLRNKMLAHKDGVYQISSRADRDELVTQIINAFLELESTREQPKGNPLVEEMRELANEARGHLLERPCNKIKCNIKLLRLVQLGTKASEIHEIAKTLFAPDFDESAPPHGTEYAWVIEDNNPKNTVLRYWFGFAFTEDYNSAIRFSRKEDAKRVADTVLKDISVKVVEHGWLRSHDTRIRTAPRKSGDINAPENGESIGCSDSGRAAPGNTGIGKDDVERLKSAVLQVLDDMDCISEYDDKTDEPRFKGSDIKRGISCCIAARDELEAAYKSIAAMPRPATGWMPIESAPKDGTDILTFKPGEYSAYYIAKWNKYSKSWEDSEGFGDSAEYWTPLPSAPDGE